MPNLPRHLRAALLRAWAQRRALPLLALCAVLAACSTQEGAPPPTSGESLRLTFLHTSDWHSRLLPYDLQLAATDRRLIQNYAPDSPILEPGQPLVQIGGLTKLGTLIKRERERAGDRVVWVDSGDCFQGAPIFNAFNGEVEIRALSMLGADAVVIGNHEFDKGLANLAHQLDNWATYPILAANYRFERGVKGAETLARMVRPYVIVNAGGLKVGIIGMANLSSLNSIGEGNNSLGVAPLDEIDTVQFYIDHLAPQVDLIGITSHMGLTGHGERHEDYEVIDRTVGLDFVFGGHLHVVLDPPQVRTDKAGRPVVLTHSGAFLKYLGRLDVVVEDSGDPYLGWEVTSHRYELFPLDSSVPDDPEMVRLLEPYIVELNRRLDLTRIIAYAPQLVPRFGREKANSELGNIAAEAMADRRGVQADFALTNTLGIRTDIIRGPITQDQMFNVFPFDNFVTKMFLSGREVCDLMTFVSRRSAGRGCQPQAQFSDRVHVKLNCVTDRPECSFASEVATRDQVEYVDCREAGGSDVDCDRATRVPIDPLRIYEVAVNDYIARGGSGFRVLKFNNTKLPTDISIRDAVSERFQTFPLCTDVCEARCAGDAECLDRLDRLPLAAAGCEEVNRCFEDVSAYYDRFCAGRAERDPRDVCDVVEASSPPGGDGSDALWDQRLRDWCASVRLRAADLPAGVEFEDECFVVSQVLTETARRAETDDSVSLDGVWSEARQTLERLGYPPPSDRCLCRLDASLRSDSECRQLACVLGRADDRMETQVFETLETADTILGTEALKADTCANLALVGGCDAEDLRGIGLDEEPN